MNVCIFTKCSHVVSLCSYCTRYVCHQTRLVGIPACTSSLSVLHSPCKQLCGQKNIKFQDRSWHPASSFCELQYFHAICAVGNRHLQEDCINPVLPFNFQLGPNQLQVNLGMKI